MKKKNYLRCLPPVPFLFSATHDLEYIFQYILVGLLVFIFTRSIVRNTKKLIVKDELFWILSIVSLSLISFVFFETRMYFAPIYHPSFETSYLLIYALFFAILFFGLIILKIFSLAKIKKIILIVSGALLLFFLALFILI